MNPSPDDSINIFDISGGKTKKPDPLKNIAPPKQMEEHSSLSIFDTSKDKKTKVEAKKLEISKEELDLRMKQMLEAHDEVEKKLDELYRKSGFTPNQISQFLNNTQNLNQVQQRILEEWRAKLDRALGKDKGTGKRNPTKEKPKQGDHEAKRKGKTLGGRKRWLSM